MLAQTRTAFRWAWLAVSIFAIGNAGASRVEDFAWLDQATSEAALKWAAARSAQTRHELIGAAGVALQSRLAAAFASAETLPFVFGHGPYLYTWAKDVSHPHGVLKRSEAGARSASVAHWDDLLDLDSLGKKEGKSWSPTTADIECRPDHHDRCLLFLSPDGGDHAVLREFDTKIRDFVAGFNAPLSSTVAHWLDDDHLLISTDFGPGSLNRAGLPKQVRIWARGTPLAEAKLLVDGLATDLSIEAVYDTFGSTPRIVVTVVHAGEKQEVITVEDDGRVVPIDLPERATYKVKGDWIAVLLREDWRGIGDLTPAGSLLIVNINDTRKTSRRFHVLFEPAGGSSVVDFRWSPRHLVISTLESASTHIRTAEKTVQDGWLVHDEGEIAPFNFIEIGANADSKNDEYWLRVTGFLNAGTLLRKSLDLGTTIEFATVLPAFDASDMEVTQHFATSKDGTHVPYFQVSKKGLALNGRHPTLVYGYGGFGIPVVPLYHPDIGAGWLEKGGVYVSANIRGGSEFGPSWHETAVRENKHRSYEDFAAVASDLVARGVTSPPHMGAFGSSNGGLLIGNMLTQYPSLFGALEADIPVFDLRTFVKQGNGPLWISEYGNPEDACDWRFMQRSTVLQNIRAGKHYPPFLVTTSTADDRVGPGQAREVAARLSVLGYTKTWFSESTNGGHGGGDRDQRAEAAALRFSFFWKYLK